MAATSHTAPELNFSPFLSFSRHSVTSALDFQDSAKTGVSFPAGSDRTIGSSSASCVGSTQAALTVVKSRSYPSMKVPLVFGVPRAVDAPWDAGVDADGVDVPQAARIAAAEEAITPIAAARFM